ncbi:MAG: response regulator transcription factor [Tannerellaceae bacterium]
MSGLVTSYEEASGLHIETYKSEIDDIIRRIEIYSQAMGHAAYISINNTGLPLFISDKYIKLTGYSKEEAEGFGFNFLSKTIDSKDRKRFMKIEHEVSNCFASWMSESRLNNFIIQYNYRLETKLGTLMPVDCTLMPVLFNAIGRPLLSVTYANVAEGVYKPRFLIYDAIGDKRFIYNERMNKFVLEAKVELKSIEVEILRFIAKGNRELAIARKLDIDINLLKYYKKSILAKFSVGNMPEAVYYALRNGII